MYEHKFSSWFPWKRREDACGVGFPGVYALSISTKNNADRPFKWSKEIVYVGMTNAASGLKGRLTAFDNTISGKTGHGGADRVRFKHRIYKKLVRNLYVAIAPFECDPTSIRPRDLVTMGDVAKFEYLCFGHFVAQFGELPEFNDKRRSPKYSKSVSSKSRR